MNAAPGRDGLSALEALELLIDQAMPANWDDAKEDPDLAAAWRQAQEVRDRLRRYNRVLWAVVSDKGVAAYNAGGEWIPLIANLEGEQLDALREHGQGMAAQMRMQTQLVRYTLLEVVETFYPETGHG